MLRFTIRNYAESDAASVKRLLQAHLTYTRVCAAKSFFLHLLALAGVVVWVGAMWPAALPPQMLDDALALWVALLFFAALASVEEWLWHRKVARYKNNRESRRAEDAG